MKEGEKPKPDNVVEFGPWKAAAEELKRVGREANQDAHELTLSILREFMEVQEAELKLLLTALQRMKDLDTNAKRPSSEATIKISQKIRSLSEYIDKGRFLLARPDVKPEEVNEYMRARSDLEKPSEP